MKLAEKSQTLRIYEVNNCLIDLNLKEITHDYTVIQPEAETFDTLVYLIENRDHIIDLEEFRKNLWHDSEVSEFEIVRTIAKARRAILDDQTNPIIVYNTTKPGYQFIGEVLELEID